MSDTHGRHQRLVVPPGDVLVHAGDCTIQSDPQAVGEFLSWFAAFPHGHKILVAGNHDWLLEREPEFAASLLPPSVTYLQDSGCVIEGLNFWGSPVTPRFYDWAFNRDRGEDIAHHWAMIPAGTDVVITHGPAKGLLDAVRDRGPQGCADLRRQLEAIHPRLHVCGHIHSGHGTSTLGRTRMINAAICNEDYSPIHTPIVIDL